MTKRHVSIHLTPFAPGVGEAAIGDNRRWLVMWTVTPAMALAHLCHRLQVEPWALTVAVAGDDLELHGPSAEASGGSAVLALVAYGLDAGEVRAALDQLAQARRKSAA
jgi:hypothetical protein